MAHFKSESPNALVQTTAKKLKDGKLLTPPEWSAFAKTGVHKERPPADVDWWYTRGAAVLRTVALRGPIGVSKLRTKYGGRKNMGVAPEHHRKGSGSVIRKVLQQLEAAELIKKHEEGIHKGRVVTKAGKDLLNGA